MWARPSSPPDSDVRVAIIGAAGNFGSKRLRAIARTGDEIATVCDVAIENAALPPEAESARRETDYRRVVEGDEDVVVVALPDAIKLEVVAELLAAGRTVLAEKPLALRRADVQRVFDLAQDHDALLYTGYNLRFFPGLRRLDELVREEYFGPLHQVRMFYGHGGVHALAAGGNWRLGSESWGGSFVDMGTHLLRLAADWCGHVESGLLEQQHAVSRTVEDGCTALLRANGCVLDLTSSWTAWRSRFSVELYGRDGFAELEGLVKYEKYGQEGETLLVGRRSSSGAPETTVSRWSVADHAGSDPVDAASAELEYLDEEWRWLRGHIEGGTFDLAGERAANEWIADVTERFYV
jgi:predicted dehydrogenase